MNDLAKRSLARRLSKKGDGRNYQAEIADRRREFERLKDEAERFVRSEQSPTTVQRMLADYDQQASAIYWRVPVKDYDANEIPEGEALCDEIRDFQVWIEEQYSLFQVNSDRPVEKKTGAHHVYR